MFFPIVTGLYLNECIRFETIRSFSSNESVYDISLITGSPSLLMSMCSSSVSSIGMFPLFLDIYPEDRTVFPKFMHVRLNDMSLS